MKQTLSSPANTVPILGSRFFIYCGQKGSKFTLKEEGGSRARSFFSIVDAIKFTRDLRSDGGARLTVLDAQGDVTMEWFI